MGALAMFCALAGVFAGYKMIERNNARDAELVEKTENKLENLKMLIDETYLYSAEIDDAELEEGIYKGYINSLGDPYSVYYTVEETNELFESTEGEYVGIGVVISQNIETKIMTAVQIYNGPAKEAGVQVGDILYKVNGEDISTDDVSEVVKKIKGEENTKVELTVLRENEEVTFEIERRKVQVETVVHEMKTDKIGYIQVTEFDTVTLEQFEKAIKKLDAKGMEALVVDLRSNPGGNLKTVTEMLDLLLPEGMIVYTEDKHGKKEEFKSDEEHKFTKPVAVLVNEYSASAAEIFAGAIQDYKLGPIVGKTSYGKGIVQQIIGLGDGTAVKLTISEYFTPNGRAIHGKGIVPDVEVEYEYDEKNPEKDKQLDAAIDEVNKLIK